MPSLLVELFDHHTIEKNVYQTFICDCDEVLFLSLKKITEDERLALKHFLLDQVSHVKQVHFRQISLNKITDDLNLFLTNYDSVTLDVFGGDSILAIFMYQYALDRKIQLLAMDVDHGLQYDWKLGKLEKKNLVVPTLSIQQLIALRGGKLLKSKQPFHTPKQIAAIKKLANFALTNPEEWLKVTQFFASARTSNLHSETGKELENNGKRYSYPKSIISLLTDADLLHIEEETSKQVSYTFSTPEAQLLCRSKGHILELYLYLLALESEYFDECMIGAEIDWNGIFPEADNVQNEIDVVLRKGRSIVFISCKMTDLSVEAINELELYATHFAGESCLKLIVCSGKINPVYINRCHEYGVLVIKNDQISNIIPMLEKKLKRKRG
ncbi:hypothetical protein RRU92_07750 [Streptococcus sp. DTU_2020_1001019_1_SI_AUS_MUR_006]|uniref:hypothetical protein n=1 Tax=Streptococcus sp. DTU_2020_1001019_1_SI_AUS_MUR_006 TaxID=3077584 RepID=UPI0028F1298D|nr:hypothetical protein [Streptococcus sp. DTU_2020_1001019_1_SI_AUS_MUR_006]WNS72017.1 hypothetical protein RRU92_07750 [Streptococcus sp. DTU_2020_1001019_1_SI_AUS_MUR_006]